MHQLIKLISLEANHKAQVRFLFTLISLLYLFNFYVNDIWTPNESFYAESVREMFESGNFIDIQYNYEPRYNKPPLTYWAIAASSAIFGLNEFGIRLPIVLMTIGCVWLTYLLGKRLYGEKGGIYSMVIMAVSVQLMAVKQYASPEIPLTFFFTLTMYWFLIAYQEKKANYYYLSYLALGLTVLTKGYPYIIVIGGIIGFYLLLDSNFNLKRFFKKLGIIKLHWGIPIVLVVGLSWVIYMYLTYGQDFWRIFQHETFERAFTRNEKSLRPFFYFEVISWSIAPYSLCFFFALGYYLLRYRKIKSEIAFPFAWFLVMLVIFSAAKGKIPTYFIQAHPAMALMITSIILYNKPKGKILNSIWNITFLIPLLLLVLVACGAVHLLSLNPLWYAVPTLLIIILIILFKSDLIKFNKTLFIAPFYAIMAIYLLFAAYLPQMEPYRPYDQIGKIINQHPNLPKTIPLKIQSTLIHNMPFYAERKVIRDQTVFEINQSKEETIAMVREENLSQFDDFEILWSGWIYDFPSESQFAKFVTATLEAKKKDFSKFEKYFLIYRKQPVNDQLF